MILAIDESLDVRIDEPDVGVDALDELATLAVEAVDCNSARILDTAAALACALAVCRSLLCALADAPDDDVVVVDETATPVDAVAAREPVDVDASELDDVGVEEAELVALDLAELVPEDDGLDAGGAVLAGAAVELFEPVLAVEAVEASEFDALEADTVMDGVVPEAVEPDDAAPADDVGTGVAGAVEAGGVDPEVVDPVLPVAPVESAAFDALDAVELEDDVLLDDVEDAKLEVLVPDPADRPACTTGADATGSTAV